MLLGLGASSKVSRCKSQVCTYVCVCVKEFGGTRFFDRATVDLKHISTLLRSPPREQTMVSPRVIFLSDYSGMCTHTVGGVHSDRQERREAGRKSQETRQ